LWNVSYRSRICWWHLPGLGGDAQGHQVGVVAQVSGDATVLPSMKLGQAQHGVGVEVIFLGYVGGKKQNSSKFVYTEEIYWLTTGKSAPAWSCLLQLFWPCPSSPKHSWALGSCVMPPFFDIKNKTKELHILSAHNFMSRACAHLCNHQQNPCNNQTLPPIVS
jgi:hypothetical protein